MAQQDANTVPSKKPTASADQRRRRRKGRAKPWRTEGLTGAGKTKRGGAGGRNWGLVLDFADSGYFLLVGGFEFQDALGGHQRLPYTESRPGRAAQCLEVFSTADTIEGTLAKQSRARPRRGRARSGGSEVTTERPNFAQADLLNATEERRPQRSRRPPLTRSAESG